MALGNYKLAPIFFNGKQVGECVSSDDSPMGKYCGRVGRNPKTGEPAEIPVKEMIKFKCSKIYERVMLDNA